MEEALLLIETGKKCIDSFNKMTIILCKVSMASLKSMFTLTKGIVKLKKTKMNIQVKEISTANIMNTQSTLEKKSRIINQDPFLNPKKKMNSIDHLGKAIHLETRMC